MAREERRGLLGQRREPVHLTFDSLGNSGAQGSQRLLRSWLHGNRQTSTGAHAGGGGPSLPGKHRESIARMDFSPAHPKAGLGRGVTLSRAGEDGWKLLSNLPFGLLMVELERAQLSRNSRGKQQLDPRSPLTSRPRLRGKPEEL